MSPEVSRFQEIPLDSPNHWSVTRTATYESKPLIELSTDLTFKSIPTPGACLACGEPEQSEILEEYVLESDALRVEAFNMPGYGCTRCPIKSATDIVARGFVRAAQNEFRSIGDLEMVEKIEYRFEPGEWWKRNREKFQLSDLISGLDGVSS